MPYFKEVANDIINILNQLSKERLQILFGDIENFKDWFKKQNINNDRVSSI
jgi:hypothetical protein